MILSFNGLNVVITGTLQKMTREKAKALIRAAGGHPQNKVNTLTDIVVITEQLKQSNIMTGKLAAFIDLKEQGYDIQDMSEADFYDYI